MPPAHCTPTTRRRAPGTLSGWLIAAVLCTLGPAAMGRVYQWRDAATGPVQLSGHPPAWYRSGERGPRVIVYEAGRVVDDTARAVDPATRARLRATAFGDGGTTDAAAPAAASTALTPPTKDAAVAPPARAADALRFEEFKALLDAWDRAQAGPPPSTGSVGPPPPP
jgi:hypothetical protein